MRCDCCPLCPIAEDDICPESEGEYGIEHADGMLGCRHLASYEDTGLTPAEIEQLKAENVRLHKLVDNIECVMRGENGDE